MKKRKLRKPRDLGSMGFIDAVNGRGLQVYIAWGTMHMGPKAARKLAAYLIRCADWIEAQEGE